jgi:hypothetical protein
VHRGWGWSDFSVEKLIVKTREEEDPIVNLQIDGRPVLSCLQIASEPMTQRVDEKGMKWFAKTWVPEVATTVSRRGPTTALQASVDERNQWTGEEGAFYGDMFVPIDQPLEWVACRGGPRSVTPNVRDLGLLAGMLRRANVIEPARTIDARDTKRARELQARIRGTASARTVDVRDEGKWSPSGIEPARTVDVRDGAAKREAARGASR